MDIDPRDVQTIVVDLAGGGASTEVKAAVTGQRWCVVSACLAALADSDFVVLSGATALTGTVSILAADPPLVLGDGTQPVWVAPAVSTALNIDPGAGAIDGWVNVVMLK